MTPAPGVGGSITSRDNADVSPTCPVAIPDTHRQMGWSDLYRNSRSGGRGDRVTPLACRPCPDVGTATRTATLMASRRMTRRSLRTCEEPYGSTSGTDLCGGPPVTAGSCRDTLCWGLAVGFGREDGLGDEVSTPNGAGARRRSAHLASREPANVPRASSPPWEDMFRTARPVCGSSSCRRREPHFRHGDQTVMPVLLKQPRFGHEKAVQAQRVHGPLRFVRKYLRRILAPA